MSSIVAPVSTLPRAPASVTVDGAGLAPEAVAAIARDGAELALAPAAVARMTDTHAALGHAVARGVAVYGMSTGLGSRVTEPVRETSGERYSLRTIRGRATAVGEPLPTELTRAVIAVRVAGLCTGGAGASPGLARALAELLNRRVHPELPRSGSVGSSDLCLMAHVGLGVIGEGRSELDGESLPGGEALARAGLERFVPGARDGLAICSSSAVSVAVATLGLLDARLCLDGAQASAALALEGFRANLSPLHPRVAAARPAPGQQWAADGLRALLREGALTTTARPRRLQDPLSFRCVAPIHGSLHTALQWLDDALGPELTGAADNPLVLGAATDDGVVVLPTGNFQVPGGALAGAAGARAALTLHPQIVADAVEDDSTGATQAALRLREQLQRLALLVATELLVAAAAVDVAGIERLGAGTAAVQRAVRERVAPIGEDRPLGPEIELLARELVVGGGLRDAISQPAPRCA